MKNEVKMSAPPNLLVLLSDQHNPHVLGAAGDPVVCTPHLDRLAAQGTTLTSAYCPYPLCAPSRMGFLTGRHPVDIGAWDNSAWLPSDVPTFADALSCAGYETVLCGRMHFNGPDALHGFEQRIHDDVSWGATGHWLNAQTKGAGPHLTAGQTRIAVQVAGYGTNGYRAFDASVTHRACQFLEDRARARKGERPWCLVVGLILPHNPLICDRRWFDYYIERLPAPPPVDPEYLASLHPGIRAWRQRRGVEQITAAQRQRARAAYYGLVSEMDERVGQVLSTLDECGLAAATNVIYASDHGDMADEQQGMWWKSCYFEGAAGVPLIGRGPDVTRGASVDAVVSLLDVGPTLLDWADAPALPEAEGRSLCPMLAAGEPSDGWQNEAFMAYLGAHGDSPSAAIRSGPWKLMYYSEFDSCLLFDVVADPDERVNRAEDPACAQVVAELLGKIHRRWSAQDMAQKAEAARARRAVMRCTRPPQTGEVADYPRPEDNIFAFDQLPWAQEVQGDFFGKTDGQGN